MLYFDYKKAELFLLKLFILICPIAVYKYVFYFRASQLLWVKLFTTITIVLYIISLIQINPNHKIQINYSNIYIPIIFFLLAILLSNWINSPDIPVDIEQVVIFIGYFVLFFLIINIVDKEKHFKQHILLLIFTSTFIALYIILHYYGIITYLHDFGPIISPIGQKNWTSNYISLIFFILFVFFLLENNMNKKLLYFVCLLVQYTALMICQSRGIWISIFLSIIFGIFIIYKYKLAEIFKQNFKWLSILFIVLVIITSIYSTENPFNKSRVTVAQRALSTFDKEDTSINRRLLIYKVTLEMIKDRPIFGSGIGSFKYNFLDYQADYVKRNPIYIKNTQKSTEVHNEYLQIFSETGLIGLLSFLSIFILFLYKALNYFIKKKDNKKRLVLLGLFLGITCFLLHSLFSFPLHVPACGSAFFILLALTYVFLNNFDFKSIIINKRIGNTKIKKIITSFLIVIILILGGYTINNLAIKPFLAYRYAFCAEKMNANNKVSEALIYYQLSLNNNPEYGKIMHNLGATYYNIDMIDKAIDSLLKSKQYYNHQNIYYNLGLAYAKAGEHKKAEEEFIKAINLEQKFWEAYNSLASLYVYQGEYERAIEQWQRAIDLELKFKEKHIFLYYIGMAYQRMENQEEAYNYFLEALKEAPDDSPIMEDIEQELLKIFQSTNVSE
jgi:O-antigen ligase/Tfp pilus assembly protein PilF